MLDGGTKPEYQLSNRERQMSEFFSFCGASGSSHRFQRMSQDAWPEAAAVVLFAAPEGRAWRAIAVDQQGGECDEIGVFWRWREARRFGATTVFVLLESDLAVRRAVVRDLCAGLEPVVTGAGGEAALLAA